MMELNKLLQLACYFLKKQLSLSFCTCEVDLWHAMIGMKQYYGIKSTTNIFYICLIDLYGQIA